MTYPAGRPCRDCGQPVTRNRHGNILSRCIPCAEAWSSKRQQPQRTPCTRCGRQTASHRPLCRTCDITLDIGTALITASSRMDDAACIGMGEIFTSEVRADHELAREVCKFCPVIAECRELTRQMLRHGPIAGTWAGHGYGIFKTDRGAA